MTREEAIALIKNEIQCVLTQRNCKRDCEHCPLIKPEGDIREAFDMAIEALKFRGAYEIAVQAANKAFENRWTQWVEWIPCSERLPDDGEEYLVTVQCDGHSIVDIDQCFSYGWDDYGADVIAWMPLPKPYQEDSK